MKKRSESSATDVRGRLGREWARAARTLSVGLLLAASFVICGEQPAAAQNLLWTWQRGSNLVQEYGTYGTMGVAAPTNTPGARDGAATWRDSSGNLWLFGGIGYGSSLFGDLNDLWRWDGMNWTWMSGADQPDQLGSYGTRGVADAANVPGARDGGVSWTDASGNFWLFGGSGFGATSFGDLNDLWMWNGATWTWVSGSDDPFQPGTYGTKGVADPANVPGARYLASAGKNAAGDLLLFGGLGLGATTSGGLNDLWQWDGAAWTWLSGSDEAFQLGTYGTKGVPAPSNVPGGRYSTVSWTDLSGNLWLFGGFGNAASLAGLLNDLWMWDGSTWTWMSGSDAPDGAPNYGTKGVAAASNVPGARGGGAAFRDTPGNLWLFGGDGLSAGGPGYLNDLWKWDGTNWTWISGSNASDVAGVYGTPGVPAASNAPGARVGAAAWSSGSGSQIAMFGGFGYDSAGVIEDLSDLWVFEVASCTPPSAVLTAPTAVCSGSSGNVATVPNAGVGATYAWTIAGGTITAGDGSRAIAFSAGAGPTVSLSVTVTIEGGCTSNSSTLIPVSPTPGAPTATSNSPVAEGATLNLFATAVPGATYAWTGPNGFTSTAQNPTRPNATAAMAGTYFVTATVGGCSSPAGSTAVLVGLTGTLTVMKLGAGSGTVTSSPAGISCGAACSAPFLSGSQVVLTAAASAGSRFAGWAGGGCVGTAPCTVTVNGATTVSATFFLDVPRAFYSVPPCRVLDTRNPDGPLGGPALAAQSTRAFGIAGTCGIPADAEAVSVNLTVTGATADGTLTVFPGTGLAPSTTALTFRAGKTRANNAITALIGGVLSVQDSQETGAVHFILDVNGYFR